MLKFHIDLAEEAAKTLKANFLEANLKAVIYSLSLTHLISDSLTFFLHFASPLITTLSPRTRPWFSVFQFQQYFCRSSLKLCCVFSQIALSTCRRQSWYAQRAYTPSASKCECCFGMETPTNNVVITAYQLWNIQACLVGVQVL